jgi:hypothetical protein
MKRTLLVTMAVGAVVALGVGLAARCAWADDEGDEVEIKLRAPLTEIHCDTVPPTITVLGLIIDIDGAAIGGGDDEKGGLGCADLIMGQTVKVELLNDTAPLKAAEVEVRGGDESDESELKVEAPVQSVTPKDGETFISVLGLDIDVTHAALEGDDDGGDDGDGGEEAVDLTKLVAGSFVEVELDPTVLPMLVATEVEIENSGDHVDVEVVGPDGREIDDRDEAGNPVNDVDVRVAETVKMHLGGRRHGRRVTRVLHFHTRSNGSVVLSGLPTGHGRVRVTRVVGGSAMTGQGRVVVGPHSTRHRRIVLHHAG